MKILAVSDIESKYIWEHFEPEVFHNVELILSCGDLNAKYLSYLVTMIPAPLFYVPGNHDKSYVTNPPDGCTDIDGRVVTYKGVRIFGLGGCKSSSSTVHEYSDAQMTKKVKKLSGELRRSKGFDIFVTHAPARGYGDAEDVFHQGFEIFAALDEKFAPRYHFFGHNHSNGNPMNKKDIFQFGQTTMVNATGYKIIEY